MPGCRRSWAAGRTRWGPRRRQSRCQAPRQSPHPAVGRGVAGTTWLPPVCVCEQRRAARGEWGLARSTRRRHSVFVCIQSSAPRQLLQPPRACRVTGPGPRHAWLRAARKRSATIGGGTGRTCAAAARAVVRGSEAGTEHPSTATSRQRARLPLRAKVARRAPIGQLYALPAWTPRDQRRLGLWQAAGGQGMASDWAPPPRAVLWPRPRSGG